MSSNAIVLPPTFPLPGGNPQNVVDALMQLIQNQFPAIVSGAALSAVLVQQVVNLVKDNIVAILGGALTTAGLSILLPSLFVALVNLVGFTSAGVVGGSLAAFIQSAVYAGSTGGVFSALQSFGATAVVAPPVALALGGTLLVVGAGAVSYHLYQRRQRRLAAGAQAAGDDDDDSDGEDEHPPKEDQPLVKRLTEFNIFDSFRRSPKY